MSDFDALTDAAIDRLHGGDTLPALMLCDFLSESGDARGERLRRRVRDYERRTRLARDAANWYLTNLPGEPIRFNFRGNRGTTAPDVWLGVRLDHERQSLQSYVFRLMSVRGREPLPPERVNGGRVVVRPGE